jgi:hypothetical protein
MKIQPTLTVNVDESTFQVDRMSPEVQQMIAYFDDWRQKEADATSELLMIRGALKDIQATLLETIQKDRADALKKAEALGIIPASTETPAVTPEE